MLVYADSCNEFRVASDWLGSLRAVFLNQSKSSIKENQEPAQENRQERRGKTRNSQVTILGFLCFSFPFCSADEEYYENLTFSTFQIFTKAGCFIAGNSPE